MVCVLMTTRRMGRFLSAGFFWADFSARDDHPRHRSHRLAPPSPRELPAPRYAKLFPTPVPGLDNQMPPPCDRRRHRRGHLQLLRPLFVVVQPRGNASLWPEDFRRCDHPCTIASDAKLEQPHCGCRSELRHTLPLAVLFSSPPISRSTTGVGNGDNSHLAARFAQTTPT